MKTNINMPLFHDCENHVQGYLKSITAVVIFLLPLWKCLANLFRIPNKASGNLNHGEISNNLVLAF